jgi:signal transduction histidine kinase
MISIGRPRSLRTQVALGAAAVAFVIVALAGVVIASRIHGQRTPSVGANATTTHHQAQPPDDPGTVQRLLHDTERTVILVAAGAAVLTAVGVWLLSSRILAPLQRLRSGAARIRSGHDLHQRLPPVSRPQEIAELSATLNSMLDGLHTSMASVRRFTADAGHELRTPLTNLGIDLESLQRNPDLPAEQRATMLAAMSTEHARTVALLDGLQTLARGDTGTLPEHTPIDIVDLVHDAVHHARRRHPTTTYTLSNGAPPPTATVTGWPTGLRIALDNLLDNAAVHGKPAGSVHITISRPDDHTITITIADDGPGIPADQREAMKQRFTRGADTQAPGSGLGLALVDQQTRLHNGNLDLTNPPTGGLRATLVLPCNLLPARTPRADRG